MKKTTSASIITLLIVFLLFTGYVRTVHYNSEILITHIFYIPVILAAFWLRYRVVFIVAAIGFMLIITDILSGNYNFILLDLVRIMVLLFAGIFVGWMKSRLLRISSFRKYRDILFAVQEPMAIVDAQLNLHVHNKVFSETFNIGRKGSIIPILHDLVQGESLGDAINTCLDGTESVYSGMFNTANGDSRQFEIKCYPLSHEDRKNYAVMNFRDITEAAETAIRQKRILDLQKVVIDILELLNRKDYDMSVIDRILALITEKTGIEAMGLKLKSKEGYTLSGSSGSEKLTAYLMEDCLRDQPENAECFCLKKLGLVQDSFPEAAAEVPQHILWDNDLDVYADIYRKRLCSCITEAGIKSFAVIPVYSGDDIIGFFMLLNTRKYFFNRELLEFYTGIAESIGIALDRIEYGEKQKQIIEEKELLIREVHHRVKNNMQVITSLISLQASKQPDENVRSILNECQNRVRTMALVHEKLYSSNNFTSINFGSYMNSLVPILMNSYRIEKEIVKVSISVQDIQLGLNTAIPLAQLVNEILSNVFKHAFPAGRSGMVEISLARDADSGRNSLLVRDTGTGLAEGVTFPSGGNLGFQLIEALVRQIRGTIEFEGTDGVTIRVEF